MKWRFIPFQHYDPYFKTGLNQATIESVRSGEDSVVFLAGWKPNCINIGYGQRIEEEVNLDEFNEREDLLIVRRQGGGGTTYLTEDGEITWSIVAPAEEYPEDVNKIYQQVCGRIAEGLSELGIDAWHEPINDIVSENGKLSGATVKKKDGVVYIGGTLLYEVDPEEMFSLLTPEEEKLEDKEIKDFRHRVSSISQDSGASFDETVDALRKALLSNKDFYETEWTEKEVSRSRELADKYSSEEWLYRNGK